MKLFERKDHYEGQGFAKAVFGFGKMYQMAEIWKNHQRAADEPECWAFTNEWRANGWYVIINVPFIFKRPYIDPNSYFEREGPCRLVYLITRRTPVQLPRFIGDVHTTKMTPTTRFHKDWMIVDQG